ncbi:hypothetical protein V502_05927 [Pseudogymnoascus sp. VKM F-4520 (FW-2644)]|nr:hypothetical protein V502_05927 [Pseudogymnoascus sp. VKM F-4520 (FW-2644)]
MSPSSSQSLPTGKDPPGGTTNTTRPSSIVSPRLPYATLQPSQAQEAQEATNMARPPFAPFFTLVDDATSSSTHHPINVRYIFSDDDDQDLTDDYLAAISGDPSQSSSNITHSESSSLTSSSRHQQRAPPRDPRDPQHRTILVDLDATGTAVTSAQSLSSSWQILSASVTKAPTWESGPTAEDDAGSARFMLRLEGTRGRDEGMAERVRGMWREDPGDVRAEDFQVLMEEFERKMRVLKTVVETGDETLGVEEGEGEGEKEDEGKGEKDGGESEEKTGE